MKVKIIVFLLSSFTLVLSIASENVLKHHIVLRSTKDVQDSTSENDWWKTAIIYQIYPRSYMDSDGDGIGDLQGIINKLQHVKDMGATAAWLSPIYKSPGVDQGYDISNFIDIEPVYGNLTILKKLINKAHELGIKIIMDYVPNHTSDQHEWFQKSLAKKAEYDDYYIWHDAKKDGPPNNWISNFGGSAWEFSKKRNQYFYHQFAPAQPDLNFRNKKVVQAMKNVILFWLDFGVDGFRMDAVPFLFEDKDFRDEPRSGIPGRKSDEPGYTRAIYTTNLDETYDLVYQFRELIDNYNKNSSTYRVMMTEAYADTIEETLAYYGNQTTNGGHFTFNFKLLMDLHAPFNADDIITAINKFLTFLDKKYVSNWVLGNHDQHRLATRMGVDNVDGLNMLAGFLPGIQITYMGEEIGMENGKVTCEQGFDPQAIKNNCSKYDMVSRDFERTPFHWDDTANAGFSTNQSTWLPVSEKYKENNLKAQTVDGKKTHYNVYKTMSKFRENFKNISYDALSLIKLSDNVLQITRKTNQREYVYLFNMGDEAEEVRVFKDEIDLEVVVTSIGSKISEGEKLPTLVTLQPHESIILQQSNAASNSNPIKLTWWLLTLGVILILKK